MPPPCRTRHRSIHHPFATLAVIATLPLIAIVIALLHVSAHALPLPPKTVQAERPMFPILSPSVHTAMFEAPVVPVRTPVVVARNTVEGRDAAESPEATVPPDVLASPIESFWKSIQHAFDHIFHRHSNTTEVVSSDSTGNATAESSQERRSAISSSDTEAVSVATAESVRAEHAVTHGVISPTPAVRLSDEHGVDAYATTVPTVVRHGAGIHEESREDEMDDDDDDGADVAEQGLQAWVGHMSTVIQQLRAWLDVHGMRTGAHPAYTIVSSNATTVVARVHNRVFADGEHSDVAASHGRPVRIERRGAIVQVVVRERLPNASRFDSVSYGIRTTGSGRAVLLPDAVTLHHVDERRDNDDDGVDDNGDDNGGTAEGDDTHAHAYDIVIRMSGGAANGENNETRKAVRVATSVNDTLAQVVEEWHARAEEDGVDFLRKQMDCQRRYGASGVKRMLCTCEEMHAGAALAARRLLCLSRIGDKVVRTAKHVGLPELGRQVLEGARRCQQDSHDVGEGETCLKALLQDVAGDTSMFHAAHGRAILGVPHAVHGGVVDAALAREEDEQRRKMMSMNKGAVDFSSLHDADGEDVHAHGNGRDERTQRVVRCIMGLAYAVGVTLVVVCVLDLGRQVRGHRRRASTGDGDSAGAGDGGLPGWARKLYSCMTVAGRRECNTE